MSSEREKEYIVGDFGYEASEVAVTGLSRFDSLFDAGHAGQAPAPHPADLAGLDRRRRGLSGVRVPPALVRAAARPAPARAGPGARPRDRVLPAPEHAALHHRVLRLPGAGHQPGRDRRTAVDEGERRPADGLLQRRVRLQLPAPAGRLLPVRPVAVPRSQGSHLDLDGELPGPIVFTEDDVIAALEGLAAAVSPMDRGPTSAGPTGSSPTGTGTARSGSSTSGRRARSRNTWLRRLASGEIADGRLGGSSGGARTTSRRCGCMLRTLQAAAGGRQPGGVRERCGTAVRRQPALRLRGAASRARAR